jgi:hypothetical protein
VTSGGPVTSEEDEEDFDVEKWRTVRLTLNDASKGLIRVSLLRPAFWVASAHMQPGARIAVNLPDVGLRGIAEVTAVENCPPVATGTADTQIITGTFCTQRAPILRLCFESLDAPLCVTPGHPFYSLDKASWRRAVDLEPGESVLAYDGTATLESVEYKPPNTVYNIEVRQDHSYCVSSLHIVVHNPCSSQAIGEADGYHSSMGDPSDWKFLREKPGSGVRSHDKLFMKMYEFWEDAWGVVREVHYLLRSDGTVFAVKIVE